MDFAENTLFTSFASFADPKLLDFSQASNSMTLRMSCGIYCMHVLLTLGAYTLGTVVDADHVSKCSTFSIVQNFRLVHLYATVKSQGSWNEPENEIGTGEYYKSLPDLRLFVVCNFTSIKTIDSRFYKD